MIIINNSSECLKCGLEKLKKEFEDIRLKHQIEGLKYKTVINSNGFFHELMLNSLQDDIFITILKARGYDVIKKF
jgi:hypothetical protein